MKCIRITGHTDADGVFRLLAMTHESEGTAQTPTLDDWNTVCQILRLRHQDWHAPAEYGDALPWIFPVEFGKKENGNSFPLVFPFQF